MKRWGKIVLSAFIATTMVLVLIPGSLFATGGSSNSGTNSDGTLIYKGIPTNEERNAAA